MGRVLKLILNIFSRMKAWFVNIEFNINVNIYRGVDRKIARLEKKRQKVGLKMKKLAKVQQCYLCDGREERADSAKTGISYKGKIGK